MAYEARRPQLPLTFHTDRGSNYLSKTFRSYLQSLGVTQSFSRAHTPRDNSPAGIFFSNLKREELYRTRYCSENKFRAAVDKYMIFYNEQRPHAYSRRGMRRRYFARQAAKQDKYDYDCKTAATPVFFERLNLTGGSQVTTCSFLGFYFELF